MTVTTTGMSAAMLGLREALEDSRGPGASPDRWRWLVRQRMTGLRDALIAEGSVADEGWLAAREGSVLRERSALLARLSALGSQVMEGAGIDDVRRALDRLLNDIAHHVQRLHDIAYDHVEIELGGSE
jgi:hypothetical protein